jgi:hypothetical protein
VIGGFCFVFMLNLSIVMKKVIIVLLVVFLIPSLVAQAQSETDLGITSPQPGQVVQGLEVITGTVGLLGFSSYELSFAYSQDQSGTWFPFETSGQPVFAESLGTWDTTVLTDGDYDLRLQVYLLDETVQEIIIPDLRVRNYTAAPTEVPLPTPTDFAQLVVPTARYVAPDPATPTPSFPTPTALPPNPVALDRQTILFAIARGAVLAILGIIAIAFLLRPRKS